MNPTAQQEENYLPRAGIFKKSMGARHQVGIGLLYRLARLHRLAEFIPWNRFRGPIHVQKYQHTADAGVTYPAQEERIQYRYPAGEHPGRTNNVRIVREIRI
jgi:hypothetical protein